METNRMTVDMSAVMREAIREKADMLGQTDAGLVRSILSDALKEEMRRVFEASRKTRQD